MLRMYACEGCGATAEAKVHILTYPPIDWITVHGPATDEEIPEYRSGRPERHVCSPACLVVLAQRLAELPDAIQPCSEVGA